MKKTSWSKKVLVAGIALAVTFSGGLLAELPKASAATSDKSASTSAAATADKIIKLGEKYMGTPYKFGAKAGQTSNFDCSSFVQYVYKQNGITLKRASKDQAKQGKFVDRKDLQKGDLIFFGPSKGSKRKGKVTHVAIYAGDNKILHTYGKPGVTYSKLEGNWSKRYVTARRVL